MPPPSSGRERSGRTERRGGATAHHRIVVNPPEVGHAAGKVMATAVAEPDGVTDVAQWISRRSVSIASRALCCAWKRRFMSSSPFDAETKTVVRPPMTTERIATTVMSSTSE